MRLTACVFLAVLLVPAAVSAAARWQPVTPPGGSLVALAEAPSAPQTLYAAAQRGRLYRSSDGGATWRSRSRPAQEVLALHVDPQDAETAYAETSAGLLRSDDGGRTWTSIDVEGSGLAVDRGQPGVLYAGTYAKGLLRSTDHGATWTSIAFAGMPVEAVALDAESSSTLFAITGFREPDRLFKVWKSSDAGATWAETGLQVTPPYAVYGQPRLVVDPGHGGTVYAAFDFNDNGVLAPIFRSGDGGATWTELTAAVGLRDLAVAADGDLFGTTSFGIARSHDGGATWVPPLPVDYLAPVKPRDRIARLVASVVPGRLLAAGAVGFWASNDHGATWAASNQGIAAHGAWSVAVSPVGPPTVLATAGASVFRSTDAGASWLRLHSALDGVQPFSIAAFDPRDPQAVYGSGSDGQADFITASTDGGGTWSQLPVPYECGGDSVCEVGMSLAGIDPGEPRTLFVAGHYFFHFIGMGDFLLKSDDHFATWTPLTPLHRLGSLLVDTEQADSLYGLTCTGLRHSRDGGRTWQKTGRGLPKALCPQSGGLPTLVRDPLHPRTFYAATLTRGVFMSTDGGATFRSISRGLETGWITTLLIDPQEPSRLYAGVAGRGVFRWNAAGARWLPLHQGLPVRDYFGDLALDPQKPTRLYAAHPVHGLFRLDLDATEL